MESPLAFIYQIKRSLRVTRVRIVVRYNCIEVIAPVGITERQISQFVQAKQLWVMQSLAKMAQANAVRDHFASIRYVEGADVLYQGQVYKLVIKATTLKRIKIEFTDYFTVYIPEATLLEQCSEIVKKALMQWLKKQTRLRVQEIVEQYAQLKGLFPRTICVKAQKSRWGSCGIYGDIHINWLLMMAPSEILEYVVVHELCHLQIRNHSGAFWCLVAEHLPDYCRCRQWLKTNGRTLMAFND